MKDITITDVRANLGDSAFLIDDGTTAVLYDSGFAFTGYEVARNIKKALGSRSLNYIFLTHSHYDHALGSVYALKQWNDAKVVASGYASRIFAKPSARAVMRELDQKYAAVCSVDEYDDLIDNLRVDIAVAGGDVIKAGNMEFEVIALPGHTRCSVGYYCAAKKLLLGTETIGVYNGAGDVVPSYLVSYEMSLQSIDSLANYDIEHILVPHFGLLSAQDARDYLTKARQRAVTTFETIAALHSGGADRAQIIDWFKHEFYHDYIKKIYPVDAMELNTGIMIDLITNA
ncbi:MAG: MBL fold metallo-hydrolase [Clostridia bacterium]|nr:MBL fold metallo-hydrolase [Clostridia bacterium]